MKRRLPSICSKLKKTWCLLGLGLLLALPAIGESPVSTHDRLLWSASLGGDSEVRVREKDGVRRLLFWDGQRETEEARMLVRDPDRLEARYLRQMLAASSLLEPTLGYRTAREEPRILVVGLGAGLLSRQLARVHPSAEVVSVEISAEVANAAERFFDFRPGERQKVVIADGRGYLESNQEHTFDLVILDAFDGLEVPGDLRSLEFFELLKDRLAPEGLVILNLHYAPIEVRDRYTASMRAVFPTAYHLPGTAQGVVLLGPLVEALSMSNLVEDVTATPELSTRYGVPIAELLGSAVPLSAVTAVPYRDSTPEDAR